VKLGGFTVLSTVYRVRKCGGEKNTARFFFVLLMEMNGGEWPVSVGVLCC